MVLCLGVRARNLWRGLNLYVAVLAVIVLAPLSLKSAYE